MLLLLLLLLLLLFGGGGGGGGLKCMMLKSHMSHARFIAMFYVVPYGDCLLHTGAVDDCYLPGTRFHFHSFHCGLFAVGLFAVAFSCHL